jgi:acetyl-CoA carboxylase biotin carboxylase subunit
LEKILIANRGEIAVRIVRACRDLGVASVAVYSEGDRAAPHVRMADEAVPIGPSPPAESYLHIERLLNAARATGADAVHPGYGFLSENASFAMACRRAGLTFIGPSPGAIACMGDKVTARRTAIAAGVPVVPGTDEPFDVGTALDVVAAAAERIGYPLMVKAVAGGGGRGMRAVSRSEDLPGAVKAARSEAVSAFGDGAVFLERWLERPRHIEVQLLADQFGAIVPFVERECSIQRRHQKVIEESPSPAVAESLRARLAEAAVALATAAGYTNAGTVEFLVDRAGAFYFLEMNTRLQVEHAVTEMVAGVDLVTWQIRLARGDRLDLTTAVTMVPRGHAIECRVYAEDPYAGFLPSSGRITAFRMPAGPGLRDDSGVDVGSDVSVHYDPLIAKLIAWGEDRPQAIARMARAMCEIEVAGIHTSVPLFRWLLTQPAFIDGAYDTESLEALLHERRDEPCLPTESSHEEVAAIAAALYLAAVLHRVISPAGPDMRVSSQQLSGGRRPPPRGWLRTARLEAVGQ